ncbi:Uncharacterized protein BM_BM6446 [Brugia malayi]|uniref:Sugar transporter SWEET1 n=1 Tax=Brugia malayi TaxID=6279 RepID=A0A4E9FAY2_BRUMA|nr:Uncharacterized protein BM_BM6446 [Brugia malayi]VIO91868.1 Uncharacterized protein BM_BM6446 [Brugia malayi]
MTSNVEDAPSSQFLSWLSIIAIGTTVCLFLAGLEICWRIRSQGTTNGISSAPFHTGFLSGQLWLQYGLLKHDKVVVFVNLVAALLYSLYISYYFLMAPYGTKHEVFRTRCTETMPLPLCCLTFLVTTEWLLYGILIDDIYIKIPNAIASVIAAVQLLPFLYFPRNKQKATIIIS